jgi:hypothetical protein
VDGVLGSHHLVTDLGAPMSRPSSMVLLMKQIPSHPPSILHILRRYTRPMEQGHSPPDEDALRHMEIEHNPLVLESDSHLHRQPYLNYRRDS